MSKLGYQPYRRSDTLRDPRSSLRKILVGSFFIYITALFCVYVWLRPEVFCLAGGIDIPYEISDATLRAWHDEGTVLNNDELSEKVVGDLEPKPSKRASSRTLVPTDAVTPPLSPPKVEDPLTPPAKEPPPTVLWSGTLDVSRCWTSQGVEVPARRCDDLPALKDALAQRLHIVARCRDELAGQEAYGKIVLGIEVDYSRGTLSIWKDPKTDIRNADEVMACVEEKLEHLSPVDKSAKYSRYMVYLPVQFPSPARLAMKLLDEEGEGQGREPVGGVRPPQRVVRVIRHNVRLRTAPVDGDVIGLVSAPEQVLLLEAGDNEWCSVVTAQKKKGWMVCWGLDLAHGGK